MKAKKKGNEEHRCLLLASPNQDPRPKVYDNNQICLAHFLLGSGTEYNISQYMLSCIVNYISNCKYC